MILVAIRQSKGNVEAINRLIEVVGAFFISIGLIDSLATVKTFTQEITFLTHNEPLEVDFT